jgi:hypothetical protein
MTTTTVITEQRRRHPYLLGLYPRSRRTAAATATPLDQGVIVARDLSPIPAMLRAAAAGTWKNTIHKQFIFLDPAAAFLTYFSNRSLLVVVV